jgi:hypothetical protein
MPGCFDVRLGTWKKGILVVSGSRGKDEESKPTPSPVWEALQKQFGGAIDAHILLLEHPGA